MGCKCLCFHPVHYASIRLEDLSPILGFSKLMLMGDPVGSGIKVCTYLKSRVDFTFVLQFILILYYVPEWEPFYFLRVLA